MTFKEWLKGEAYSHLLALLDAADLATRPDLEFAMSAISDAIAEVNQSIQGVKDRVATDTAALQARIAELVASEKLAADEGQELTDAVSSLGGITADLNTIDPVPDAPTEPAPPVDTPPVDTPPVETPPVDVPPVDVPPVEEPPVDVPPTDTPVEPAPVDTPPEVQP